MSDKARIDEITGYIIDTVIDDMLGRIRRGEATSEPKKLDSYEFKMFGGFFGSLTKEGKYITEAISNALNKFDIYPKFKKQSEKEFLVDYVISDFAFNRIKALVGNISDDTQSVALSASGIMTASTALVSRFSSDTYAFRPLLWVQLTGKRYFFVPSAEICKPV